MKSYIMKLRKEKNYENIIKSDLNVKYYTLKERTYEYIFKI